VLLDSSQPRFIYKNAYSSPSIYNVSVSSETRLRRKMASRRRLSIIFHSGFTRFSYIKEFVGVPI